MIDTRKTWLAEKAAGLEDILRCRWLSQEGVVYYKLEKMGFRPIEEWANLVVSILEDWPTTLPYLALHDLSSPRIGLSYSVAVRYHVFNIGITQQGEEKVATLIANNPFFRARVAVVFNSTHSGHLSNTLTSGNKTSAGNIVYSSFFDENRALAWLSEAQGQY